MPFYGSIDSMMEKSTDNVINIDKNNVDDDLSDDFQLDQDQYFYLKHHLLPDHENMDTYDGNVKKLSIKIPESQQWQQKHLRRNMTSLYEQQQQTLYGRIYDTMTNMIINDGLSSSLSSSSTGIRPQMSTSQQQYARRQIESNKNKILIPELVIHSSSKQNDNNKNDDNNLATNSLGGNSVDSKNNSHSVSFFVIR